MSKYNFNINGKTVEDYDKNWIKLGKLITGNINGLKGEIGLYKISENSEVIYIGKATESYNGNKGLYKRLNNYITQKGKSEAHKYIHKKHHDLDVSVIKLGKDIIARATANGLEILFINYYDTILNNHR